MTNKNYYFFGLIFSLIYIFLEITFNLGLIDFINSKNTEISVFNQLEMLGRLLSSIGFSLFLVKLINNFSKLSKNISIILFVVVSAIFYFGETIVFNKIVDNLSPEQKFNAYSFGVYRNLSLNSQIDSSLLNNEDKEYGLVINSMLGILSNKPEIKDAVQGNIKSFFTIEMNIDPKSLGEIYDKINLVQNNYSDKYEDYWKRYVIESRRYENYNGFYKNKYKENFIKTIGIEPSLDKVTFIKALKNKSESKNLSYINNIEIIPENSKINMSSLKIGDIPKDLNKEQWVLFVENHVQNAINKTKFAPQNVDNLPHARNIISSVVITPIAIILSLLSIILNITLLLGRFNKIIGMVYFGIVLLTAIMWNYNPYSLNLLMNKTIGVETRMVKLLTSYKKVIHNTFVNDKNPNVFDIVRIEKPKIPTAEENTDELNKKFKSLESENDKSEKESNSEVKKQNNELYIDNKKLNNSGYYGEVNKKNPYAN